MLYHQILVQWSTAALNQVDTHTIAGISAVQFQCGHAMGIKGTFILKADTQPASVFGSKLQPPCGGLMQPARPAQHSTART